MPTIDTLPLIKARWFTSVGAPRHPRVIVIHDMEAPETANTAESVARYFERGEEAQSSAHICVDNDSAVRCVRDQDIAWAAPGCNSDGLQMELAGYGKQSRTEWLDAYSYSMLTIAAGLCAEWCSLHAIPAVHLTDEELAAGKRGIVGHYQVSRVYKKSNHTDPGEGFPWDFLIMETNAAMREKAA